jgi:hypothetical protein
MLAGPGSAARPLQPGRERQPEEVTRRGPLEDELRRSLRLGHRVRLAAQDERLEREAQRLSMLFTRP